MTMIMHGLAWFFTRLFGKWLVPFVVPAMCIGLVTLAKGAIELRDARILQKGEEVCNGHWNSRIAEAELANSRARVAELEGQARATASATEGIESDLKATKRLLEDLPKDDSGNPLCISAGMLDSAAAQRSQQRGRGAAGAAKRSGAAP